jgi:hypothetical protein
MAAIRHAREQFQVRVFLGYADPRAGELGVIYRACNFQLESRRAGERELYLTPWYARPVGRHTMQRTGYFKRWCLQHKIPLQPEWFGQTGFKSLTNLPEEVKARWKAHIAEVVQFAPGKIRIPPKSRFVLRL